MSLTEGVPQGSVPCTLPPDFIEARGVNYMTYADERSTAISKL